MFMEKHLMTTRPMITRGMQATRLRDRAKGGSMDNIELIVMIAAVVCIGAGLVGIIARRDWKALLTILGTLVTTAEREYGQGTGELKLGAVVSQAWPYVSAVLKLFISVEKLQKIVDDVLATMKDKWTKNPKLLGLG
jgi:hypothetical protein